MDDLTVSLFFESWELFREAALSATFLGALLGFLGVYVVIKRMIFFSAALSQVAGLGIAASFWLKLTFGLTWLANPYLGAAVTSLLAIGFIVAEKTVTAARRDAALGLVFLVGSAGTLMLGSRIVQEVQDIESLLFGSAVAVLPEDFMMVLITTAVLGVWHIWWHRGFVAVSLDPDDARVRGLWARGLDTMLLVSLAAAISVSTRVLGALPTFAFSVLPAMAALRLAPNVSGAMIGAGIFGAIAGFGGYLHAFLHQFPVGASQTIVAAGIVALTLVVKRRA